MLELPEGLGTVLETLGKIAAGTVSVFVTGKFIYSRLISRQNAVKATLDQSKALFERKTSLGDNWSLATLAQTGEGLLQLQLLSAASSLELTGAAGLSDYCLRNRHVVVVGEPGTGKSTLAKLCFAQLAVAFKERRMSAPPQFVDRTNPKTQYDEAGRKRGIVLFDGLDEIATTWPADGPTVVQYLSDIDHYIIFCRESFFEHKLALTDDRAAATVLYVGTPSKYALIRAANAVLHSRINRSPSFALLELIDTGVVSTPLQLALCLHIIMSGEILNPKLNKLEIYQRYCASRIVREGTKSALPTQRELHGAIERLCLSQHLSSINDPRSHLRSIDLSRYNSTNGDDSLSLQTIASHQLILKTGDTAEGELANFEHSSLADFYLARAIWGVWSNNPAIARKALSGILPSEVYDFLRIFFIDVVDSSSSRSIRDATLSIISDISDFDDCSQDNIIEQACHLLGHVRDPAVAEFLTDVLQKTESAFIDRGIRIGLAFGGRPEFIEDYVEDLIQESLEELPHVKNSENLSHQFIYFGDNLRVTIPEKRHFTISEAQLTVVKLQGQIQTQLHSPSRLLDLYTLLYICYSFSGNSALASDWREFVCSAAAKMSSTRLVIMRWLDGINDKGSLDDHQTEN